MRAFGRRAALAACAIGISVLALGLGTARAAPTLDEAPKSEDGLHDASWFAESWLDIQDDLQTAESLGKRLLMVVELKGCAPCNRMHETTYREPKIIDHLTKYFHVVQLNYIGSRLVTDTDGQQTSEKAFVRAIGVKGTPSYLFFHPADQAQGKSGAETVAHLNRGYKDRAVFYRLLDYVRSEAYIDQPDFDAWLAMNGDELPTVAFD